MASFELNEPGVVAETIDGEAVVINLERGIYFSIRGTGLAIWMDLVSGADVPAVIGRMTAVHCNGADIAGKIADDTRKFIYRLLEEGLLRERTRPMSSTTAPDQVLPGGSDYQEPMLEKYTDMEALLLLDPIHDVDDTGWPKRS